MHPKAPKLLEDIRACAAYVLDVTRDLDLSSYFDNDTLRFAIERNFEIIGEALNRLSKVDPHTAQRIPDYLQIIAFRNVLIHGYDALNHNRVWQIVQENLPALHLQVLSLLHEGASTAE